MQEPARYSLRTQCTQLSPQQPRRSHTVLGLVVEYAGKISYFVVAYQFGRGINPSDAPAHMIECKMGDSNPCTQLVCSTNKQPSTRRYSGSVD